MTNCTHCKHAKWARTKGGRLHPGGDGRCTYEYKLKPLPACMCWVGCAAPRPCGGHINRHKQLDEHCQYYGRSMAQQAGEVK